MLATDQKITQSKVEVREMYGKAQNTLVNFRYILLLNDPDGEIRPAPFHYDWSSRLLTEDDNEAIQGFRESAKTQYVIRAFNLYALAFPKRKRDYIVLIKNNARLAQAKLKEIEDEYLNNPLLNRNLVEVKESSSTVFSVDVKDDTGEVFNVRIEAYGKGSSIRGLANKDRRPKIVIADDLQDKDDMRSDTIPSTDWKWFLSDLWFLGKHTRIFIIGNNLGEKCIMERIFTFNKELGFKLSKVPEIDIDGNSTWPGNRTVEEILAEKEKFRSMGQLEIWLCEKMCIATSEETKTFKKEDHRYYSYNIAEKIAQSSLIFFTIDPASSKERTSCFRAIIINAVDADGKWFILDVPYGRWDSVELIDKLFEKVKFWKPLSVGIEKGMYKQIIEPFIYKEMSRLKTFFDIKPIEHAKRGTKLERVKMLAPRFKAHNIWFPDRADWLAEMETELAGVTKDGFKSLYVDLIDALAMQEQIIEQPYDNTEANKDKLPAYAKTDRIGVGNKPIERLPKYALTE